jgi:hypothetical protein
MFHLKNNTIPDCKPGPHIDSDGVHHPPVGTFHEMLRRARFGNPPVPLDDEFKVKFIEALQEDKTFLEVVRDILNG